MTATQRAAAAVLPRGSVSRRVAFNTAAQVLGRLGGAAISLVVLRLSTRYLGVDDYGSVVAATAFVTLLATLADWGLGTIAGREMAREPQRAEAILGASLGLRIALGLALVPLAIGIAALMYRGQGHTLLSVAVMSPLLLTTALQSAATAVLVATQRNHLAAVADVGSRLVVLGAVILVIVLNLGFAAYLWTAVAGGVVAALVSLGAAGRHVHIRVRWRAAAWRPLLMMALPLGFVQVANVVYLRLDSTLLSLLRTPAEVGRYGVAYKVIEFVMAVPSFFMLALLPNLAVASPLRAVRLVQRALDVVAPAGVLAAVGGVLLAPGVIVAVSSRSYIGAATAFATLSVAAGASYIAAVGGNALVALGRQAALLRVVLTLVSANLVLNLAAIPHFGIEGAAAAMAATELVGMVYVTVLFVKSTGIRLRFGGTLRAVAAGAAMAVVGTALRLGGLDPSSAVGFVVTATVTVGVFAAVFVAIGGLSTVLRGSSGEVVE